MGRHRIIVSGIIRNWVIGAIDDKTFEAKVYDVGSEFGIDNGRVSKLAVYRTKPRGTIIAYERGWEKYPTQRYEELLATLLAYCENLPPAKYWKLKRRKIISVKGRLR